jgi:hypothetical protein
MSHENTPAERYDVVMTGKTLLPHANFKFSHTFERWNAVR